MGCKLGSTHTLGYVGRNDSNPSIGSSGHVLGTRPGQTRKKSKDLSPREREERGRGGGGSHSVTGSVYVVCLL